MRCRYDSFESHGRHGGTATTASGPAGDVRVSTAERDEVVDQLRRHAADGRLNLDEFGERVDEALAAKTGDELRRTLRELPPAHVATRARQGPSTRFLLRLAFIAAIVAAAIAAGLPWVVFPLAWFFLARPYRPWRWRRRPTRPR